MQYLIIFDEFLVLMAFDEKRLLIVAESLIVFAFCTLRLTKARRKYGIETLIAM
ncbi:MAG: hypothetical protein AB1861_00505 [Cyanobacteriota bacterium]